MPLTSGIDDAWPTRLPQGWTQLPDGSYGPSSALPDWLKQLIPSPGAGTPYGPSGYPDNLPARPYGPPGGGVMGMPGATPGGPSMGFPAQGGPQIFPPQNSTIPPNKSVGPFTGGTSTEGSYYDPRNWFKANPNATFEQGQPMGPDVTGGGGVNPLSFLARGNPAWRAAMAAGGVMTPSPADTGELPLSLSGARPMHPSSTGAMPSFPNGGRQGIGSDANFPVMGAGGFPTTYAPPGQQSAATTMANAPRGQPSATPRPGGPSGPGAPLPPRRPPPATVARTPAKPPFGTFQYQVPGSGVGPLSRSPIYTALNLFGG